MTARAAQLTPPGTGGVATIAVVGPDAWSIIRPLCRTSKDEPAQHIPPAAGQLHFGRFGEPPGDEVVLAVRSGMPEPWFEVHCHGGPQLVDWLLEQLQAAGAEIVPWMDLERMATGSWVRAAAAEQLSQALTLKTANVLLQQYNGLFEDEVRRLLELLPTDAGRERAHIELQALAGRWRQGRRLTAPWQVALVGPPNVGKSSLINALAGFERAVVTPIPGTTRDAVTTQLAFDGWPVELIDTAGVREATGELESEGIRRGQSAALAADLRIWVQDATDPAEPPADFHPELRVVNKVDLVGQFVEGGVSAKTGHGAPELIDRIVAALDPAVPTETAVPFTSTIAKLIDIASVAAGRGDWESATAYLQSLLQPEPPEQLAAPA